MCKSTPGPWTAKRAQHNHRRWCIWREGNAADRACIAETAWWLDSDPPEEEAANAHLIAAAPDLLKALEQIAMNGSISQIICKADRNFMDAAIAKARGETE